MVRVVIASVLGASMVLGGCRSCGDEKSGATDAAAVGPTMPQGMLVPSDAPSATPGAATELRVWRHVKGGAFAELQVARPGDRADRRDFERWRDDSVFVPLPAMTLLHEPFARALPGFDLFLPRLFEGEALARLAAELDAFAGRASGDLAKAARDLAALARGTAAQGQALWVLGI
ncbi:MAG TPA: hypothetical protein VLT33_17315 [Labilithrix sp.]|nr:hypothetical protein [Labilithrix sp.]